MKKKIWVWFVLIALLGGCSLDDSPVTPAPSVTAPSAGSKTGDPGDQTLTHCDGNACNCVLYARCRVPSLPFGLTYYTAKARVINTTRPSVGSVAVMNIYPPYGHVAVVEQVFADGRITVREANYVRCRVTSRTRRPAEMRVAGYFKP